LPNQEIRSLDGEPHEVATAAGQALQVAIADATEALDAFAWAARGAWLTSEFHLTNSMPLGPLFDETAMGRQIEQAKADLQAVLNRARVWTRSAGWNPKSV
jgi:gamma-glutamylcysteine synthetase